MALTGWTHDELRAQPARLVRGLMHRIYATRVWDAEIARYAQAPVPPPSAFGAGTGWADAMRSRASAADYVRRVSRALWPEDD